MLPDLVITGWLAFSRVWHAVKGSRPASERRDLKQRKRAGCDLEHFIRGGSDTPKLVRRGGRASAWLEYRSLLADDSERPLTNHTLNRLQAGSYKYEKKQRA